MASMYRGSWHKTSYYLTMRVNYFVWNKASIPTLAALFLDPLPVLIAVCEANYGFTPRPWVQ